ncbi:Arginine methyltransferase-interacting RING finger 2 [Hyphodiscus hymeniophilus]|uniref:Arginine methyltransferase-interacting RING finger 2 n=1 Tax=Hyphodiscus hymeniophilus TaxID=353542 RepID=A0A9P6VEG2_9HELO|nr:Arginine methyltransferase-interacting RING finger 2 [Hyphodiscus hymeniophilus]
MGSIEEEMEDSRTSAVGRKRNLEEIQDPEQILLRNSSQEYDEQRGAKRVKEDDQQPESVVAEDGVTSNTESPSTLPTESQIQPITAAPLRPAVWNKGVQSGLRTSFGSRFHAKPKPFLVCEQIVDTPSNPIIDSTTIQHANTLPVIDQDEEDASMTETFDQPENQDNIKATALTRKNILPDEQVLPNIEHDGEDTAMAATMDLPDSPDDQNAVEPTSLGRHAIDRIVRRETREEARSAANIASRHGSDTIEIEADSLLQAIPMAVPFKFLTQVEIRKLSGPQKKEYTQALTQHQHTQFESRTVAAEAVFAHEMLPLPAQYSSMEEEIVSGLTYFPQKRLEDRCFYEKAQIRYNLPEVLSESRPIRLENFTMDVFAPAFLKANPEKHWPKLSEKEICAAYKNYLSIYYQHCLNMPCWTTAVQRLEKDKAQFSVEKARCIAADGGLLRPQSLSDAFATSDKSSNTATENDRIISDGLSNPRSMIAAPPRSEKTVVTVEELQRLARDISSHSQVARDEPTRSEEAAAGVEETQHAAAESSSSPQSGSNDPILPSSSHGSPTNESLEIDIDQVEIHSMERNLQLRYFPATIDRPKTYRCLACGDTYHTTLDCPSLTCTLCSGNHAQSTCPQNQRCKKCRNRGHSSVDCPEKLARSQAEVIDCELCGYTDHLEEGCHFIWRSFSPHSKDIRKVREIPAHCYSCGGSGHFGPECGLRKPGRILSGGQTFSKTNLLRFVDADSVDRAISAGVDYTITSKAKAAKQFSIKGMANDPINLNDSDDGEVQFIGEKVKKPKGNGKIKVAAPKSKVQQDPDYSRQRNPPRRSRPEFGPNFVDRGEPARVVESFRYGRERTFSPPPRFDDMRYDFADTGDRFRPQSPPRGEDYYRLQPQQAHTYYQPTPPGTLPMRGPSIPSGNGPRGGGRGGRGGGNSSRGGKPQGKKPKRGGTK